MRLCLYESQSIHHKYLKTSFVTALWSPCCQAANSSQSVD